MPFEMPQQTMQTMRKMPEKVPNDKPFILYMDSLESACMDENMNGLREYMELEFIEKRVSPAQQKFFTDPIYKWKKMDYEDMPYFKPKLPK